MIPTDLESEKNSIPLDREYSAYASVGEQRS